MGAALLLVVAANRWAVPSDEHAYYLAARRLIEGQPLYDPSSSIVKPYVYLYPPAFAQALVPVVAVVPAWLFSAGWTVLMLVALWWLAGRDVLRALALLAFPPIAVEFWFRNVHLFLAVLFVLGLRRTPALHAVGAAMKVAPAIAVPYLAVAGRWRDAGTVLAVGAAIGIVSFALAPEAWWLYLELLTARAPTDQTGFVPIPFFVRWIAALVLAVAAARLTGPARPVVLVVALTLALPSLWFTGLSLLVAMVPLLREQGEDGADARPGPPPS